MPTASTTLKAHDTLFAVFMCTMRLNFLTFNYQQAESVFEKELPYPSKQQQQQQLRDSGAVILTRRLALTLLKQLR